MKHGKKKSYNRHWEPLFHTHILKIKKEIFNGSQEDEIAIVSLIDEQVY